MLRRTLRSALLGASVFTAAAVPSTLSAQASVYFQSCATPGVCGFVEAFFVGSVLSVRVSNNDNSLGSALYDVQLIFANALNPLGSAFNRPASATPSGGATSIGTTSIDAWSFNGAGGSTAVDLAAFENVFIEGKAASPYRALPGDPDNGTWVTKNGYVEFTADLSGISGVAGNSISGLGFCTADHDCVSGAALVTTPEPATLALCATGLVGLVAVRRRRKTV